VGQRPVQLPKDIWENINFLKTKMQLCENKDADNYWKIVALAIFLGIDPAKYYNKNSSDNKEQLCSVISTFLRTRKPQAEIDELFDTSRTKVEEQLKQIFREQKIGIPLNLHGRKLFEYMMQILYNNEEAQNN
jgi:hypothetical protein